MLPDIPSHPTRIRAQDLPFDILSAIFPFCLPANVFECPQPNAKVAPLLLCHICSSWRLVALTMCPRLWCELTIILEYVTAKSRAGSGFLKKKMDVMEFWTSRMGRIPPSFHFIREHLATSITSDSLFVHAAEFWSMPSIHWAEFLTLHGFSSLDIAIYNKTSKDQLYPNLTTMSVSQPSGREDSTVYLAKLNAPALRRLYFDCFADQTWNLNKLLDIFPWTNLTHLSANVSIAGRDWYPILQGCINLESGVFNLNFNLLRVPGADHSTQKRPLCIHQKLRELTIQCSALEAGDIFDSFLFPSLKCLRLSHPSPRYIPIDALNRIFVATPFVNELHLRTCIGFGFADFLSTSEQSMFGGPLSQYLPRLTTLVIDAIGYEVRFLALPDDLVTFMRSTWLSAGWPIMDQKKKEIYFILDKGKNFSLSIIESLISNDLSSCPFKMTAQYEEGGLWSWKQLTAIDLRDHWDSVTKFRSA